MTTIAEVDVMVKADTRQLEDGMDKIKRKTTEMGAHHENTLRNMRRSWMQITIAIGTVTGAFYSLFAVTGKTQELEDSLERVRSKIGDELIPTVNSLTTAMNKWGESDAPSTMGAWIEAALQSARVWVNLLQAIQDLQQRNMKQFEQDMTDMRDAWTQVDYSVKRAMGYEKSPQQPLSEPEIRRQISGPTGKTPKTEMIGVPSIPEVRQFSPYDLMMQSQVSPESRAGIRPATAQEMGVMNVSVNVNAYIDTTQDPLTVVSDVAEGALMGVTSNNTKAR